MAYLTAANWDRRQLEPCEQGPEPALMQSVHELTSRLTRVVDAAKPMIAARDELSSLAPDRERIQNLLDYVTGTGGNALQAFYRTPSLSLLKVNFAIGRRTPPHNHGTWAVILLLSGSERNTLYKRNDKGELSMVGEVVLSPGSVLPMTADTIHVAECLDDQPAIGLHVYGADVLGVERQMWDPDTLVEQDLNWSLYEPLAQRASAASHAPLTA